MSKSRLEAFTDAVIAIVMTLLVLQLTPPKEASFEAIFALRHAFFIYLISFITLAIYWNNHHHLFQLVKSVDGKILWANNFLIFALSLFPFATDWVSAHLFELVPEFFFGVVILFAALMFALLYFTLLKDKNKIDANFAVHNKSYLFKIYFSITFNILALVLGALFAPILILIIDSLVLILWFIPSKQAEKYYN